MFFPVCLQFFWLFATRLAYWRPKILPKRKISKFSSNLCGPKSLIPKHIECLGVTSSSDLNQVLNWCDAANILRIQNERMGTVYFPSNREYSQNFGLNLDRLKQLKKKIIILHPGPINRGVEISSDVADSNQSIILDQVQNGVAIRMAIIYLLGSKLNIKSNV